MFLGRWDAKIDPKWRLYIPAVINKQFGKSVLLKEGEDGCILLQKQDLSRVKDSSHVFVEKIRNGGRIIIPDFLRSSNSFYFGKNVTVTGRGDHLKIMPRP